MKTGNPPEFYYWNPPEEKREISIFYKIQNFSMVDALHPLSRKNMKTYSGQNNLNDIFLINNKSKS